MIRDSKGVFDFVALVFDDGSAQQFYGVTEIHTRNPRACMICGKVGSIEFMDKHFCSEEHLRQWINGRLPNLPVEYVNSLIGLSEDSQENELEFVDCLRVPANVDEVKRTIDALGECKIVVSGQTLTAVSYEEDDLILEDGTSVVQGYWKDDFMFENPTKLSYLIVGYWKEKNI